MKKKILSGIFAVVIIVVTGYGINMKVKNDANLSDLVLANVEALAQGEGTVSIPCIDSYGNKCSFPCTAADGTLRMCTMDNMIRSI